MVTIIDYGMGNIGSIINMFKKIKIEAIATSDPDEILNAKKILLPGVGSFDNGMKNLHEKNLIEVLNKKVLEGKTPILGICLGMQLLLESSEEGSLDGLGYIPGRSVKFEFKDKRYKVPHMGWNVVIPKNGETLFHGLEEGARFYFVHSYKVVPDLPQNSLGETNYVKMFSSSVSKDNIYGVQFHPEKSHRYGMQLLKNFYERC